MMGPGMMGYGMMGRGMMGYNMMGQGGDFPDECEEMMSKYGYRQHPGSPESKESQTREALTQEDAVSIVQNYLVQTGNPNLTIGEVAIEEGWDYLVEIVTRDGSLVDKLEVDRLSGWTHSVYSE